MPRRRELAGRPVWSWPPRRCLRRQRRPPHRPGRRDDDSIAPPASAASRRPFHPLVGVEPLADIVAPYDARALTTWPLRIGVEPFALFEPAEPTNALAETDDSHL